jgi:hypothetical protein
VTAANVEWQMRGEPIFFASNFYWPTGPDVFFDGRSMVRSGQYEGIPIYVDSFLPSYSVVYLPVGGNVMRPYVKRTVEAGRIGSVGAPVPTFADRPPDVSAPIVARGTLPVPVGTGGTVVPRATDGESAAPTVEAPTRRTIITATPRTAGARNGVWLTYQGAKYYQAGPAVTFSSTRFLPIGTYRGFVVYRDINGRADEIFIPAVKDGPLAPYRR